MLRKLLVPGSQGLHPPRTTACPGVRSLFDRHKNTTETVTSDYELIRRHPCGKNEYMIEVVPGTRKADITSDRQHGLFMAFRTCNDSSVASLWFTLLRRTSNSTQRISGIYIE